MNNTQQASANQAVMVLDKVHKSYGKTQALKDVSFELEHGFYALLGSNGAGKSTLFQLLTGLFVPDSGSIHLAGLNLKTQMSKALAQIGVVFQQPALDLGLSVQANLVFHGRLHGLSSREIKQRTSKELEQLGIADTAKKPCKTLSGGNRRKVELARALLAEPQILLMDEATVGLDPASRETLLNYVHQLCSERQLCVLWATHLIDEAEQAKQILVLNKGELLAQATAAELQTQTDTPDLLTAFLTLSGQTLPEPVDVQRI